MAFKIALLHGGIFHPLIPLIQTGVTGMCTILPLIPDKLLLQLIGTCTHGALLEDMRHLC